jgi:site-specific DNA-adenine methylase
MMFSYYGAKTKIIHNYPPPEYDHIIEPFAGSARYALYGNNWKRQVTLIDKFEPIARVWKFLQSQTAQQILALPLVADGEKIPQSLTQEERWLIGVCVNHGSAAPKQSASGFNGWDIDRDRIAKTIHKIRHWEIIHGDYRDYPNVEATWFIDPPYQGRAGSYYVHSVVDYDELAAYCQDRNGQSIVCETLGASWLPFDPICKVDGQTGRSSEVIWQKGSGTRQLSLFGARPQVVDEWDEQIRRFKEQ